MKRSPTADLFDSLWLNEGQLARVRITGPKATVKLLDPEAFRQYRYQGERAAGPGVESPAAAAERFVSLKPPRAGRWYVVVEFEDSTSALGYATVTPGYG